MEFKKIRIKKIKHIGIKQTYDIEMPEEHSYIANSFVVHNSVGDGFANVKDIASALRKKGFKGCALTDHGTLAGVWDFQKACLLEDIKPIIGSEFYSNLEDKDGRYHLTVLVKDEEGWRNILKLQSIATREGFYYKPTIKVETLLENCKGLIVLSGCASGLISKFIDSGELEKAEELILKFKEKMGDDFYIEIQPHVIGNNQEIQETLHMFSKKHNIKCVITTDAHYPYKDDKKFHDAVKAINMKKKYGEANFGDDCFYLMQDEEIKERVETKCEWMKDHYKEFMENTNEVFDKCNFKIEPVEERDTLPRFCSVLNEKRYYEKEIKNGFFIWKEKIKKGEEKMLLTLAPKVENE